MRNNLNPEFAASSSSSSQSSTFILGALSAEGPTEKQKQLPLPGVFVMSNPAINIEAGPALKNCKPLKNTYDSLVEVVAGSTWQSNNPEPVPQKNATADVFSLMMRETGLPIAVMLDGCGFHAEYSSIEKLGDELLVFANQCADYVEYKNPTQEALTEWVKAHYAVLDRRVKQKAEFDASFSLVMVCRTKNGLKAVGIATGDTLALLEKGNTAHTLLPAYNAIDKNNTKDGVPFPFPCPDWGKANLTNTLAQLQVVMAPVDQGDRFVLLTDGAYEAWPCKEYKRKKGNCEFIVREINAAAWDAQQSVASLSQIVWKNSAENFSKLKENNIPECYGDDACFAGLTIPNMNMQRLIQFRCAEQQIANFADFLEGNPEHKHSAFLEAVFDKSLDLIEKAETEIPYITRILWLSKQWAIDPNETNTQALKEMTDYLESKEYNPLELITAILRKGVPAINEKNSQEEKPNKKNENDAQNRNSCLVM